MHKRSICINSISTRCHFKLIQFTSNTILTVLMAVTSGQKIFYLHFLLEVIQHFSSSFSILKNNSNVMNENHWTVEAWRTKPRCRQLAVVQSGRSSLAAGIQLEKWKSSATCASSPAVPVSPAMRQHKDRMKPESVMRENDNCLGKSNEYFYMENIPTEIRTGLGGLQSSLYHM